MDFLWGVSIFLPQMSSGVLMGIDASHHSKCVTGTMTVKTDLMKWTVRVGLRAAISSVITTLAVYQRPSCAMARETALMGRMRKSVVGDVRYLLVQKLKSNHRCNVCKMKMNIKITFLFSSFQVWWPVRSTSTAVLAVSVCLRPWDVMDMLTAATALMRWIAQDPHAAQCNSDAQTATSACRRSGSVMVRTTAKTGQTRR